MSADVKPSVIGSAILAWRDAFRALGRMAAMAGVAFLLLVMLRSVNAGMPPAAAAAGVTKPLAQFALGILEAFLMTPLAIAVHRHVLLGEVTRGYLLDPSQPRFLRFFGFAVMFNALLAIPSSWWPLWLVGAVVAVHLLILFPAIAVDAPGAGWRNALRDSRGHFWRTLVIMALTELPAIAGLAVLMMYARPVVNYSEPTVVILITAFKLLMLAALAAAASRLYRAFAADLGRPAALREVAAAPV